MYRSVTDPPAAPPLEALRTLLLGDAALQAELAPIDRPERFAGRAAAIAAAAGITLDAQTVQRALSERQPDRAGVTAQHWPGPDWLPGAVSVAGATPHVAWHHFAGAPLAEPFFDQSLRRARGLPINRLLHWRTPLARFADTDAALAVPDGFVFHMSRCGSTLTAQMIASLAGSVVVAEAAPLDGVVQLARARPDIPAGEHVRLLRAMVGAVGRRRAGGAPFVVKLDSWHMLALPLFRRAFPDVPWVFLHRDPREVIASHLRLRGMQTVPGAMDDLYAIADGVALPPERHIAEALACVCAAAVEHHASGGGLVVDYADLPGAVERRILPHFRVVPAAADRAALAAAAARDAKAPNRMFIADGVDWRRDADPAVEAAAAIVAAPLARLALLAA